MKILVIGDSCQDVFQYGRCERLSPEAPVPIFLPSYKKENMGMAYNVYHNIQSINKNVSLISNIIKPIKTRFVDETSNQVLLRMDQDDCISPIMEDEFINEIAGHDGVVISDYNKGYLSEKNIELIINIAHRYKIPVFLDSKKKFDDWALKVDFIKINYKEYEANRIWLKTKYLFQDNKYLIVTLGQDGARLFTGHVDPFADRENEVKGSTVNKNFEHPVRDLTGAGDTFLSAFVVKYLQDKDLQLALDFANICASWAVTQKGVAVINMNEINHLYNNIL